MPIIFQNGNNFWIEYHVVAVTLSDAAGRYDSALINLVRAGRFIGGSIVSSFLTDDDNAEAIGTTELREANALDFGELTSNFRVRVNKAIGTAGDVTEFFHVMIFLRGSGH